MSVEVDRTIEERQRRSKTAFRPLRHATIRYLRCAGSRSADDSRCFPLRDRGRPLERNPNSAAVRPYLRYPAPEALREARAGGNLSEWPHLESSVTEHHAVPRNARTTCSTMPTGRRSVGPSPDRVQRPIGSNGSRVTRGRSHDGHPKTIFRPGPSPMTGLARCRLRKPRWTCSRHGSAMFSTSCSGRANDVRILP